MADYFQRFLVPDVLALHSRIQTIRDEAAGRGLPRVAFDLDALTAWLAAQLRELSITTAARANARAIDLLEERRKRPETDSQPHLRDVIHSEAPRPELGEVGIGDLAELAQARRGGGRTGGEYWRAQELGLSEGFVGRRLHGVFTPSESLPGPFDDDTGFRTTPSSSGDGGWMVVRHPIEPKYFLTDASREAAAYYTRELRKITGQANRRIVQIAARIPAQPAGRGRGRRSPVLERVSDSMRRRRF